MAFRFPTPVPLDEQQAKLLGWISRFKPDDIDVKVTNDKDEEALLGPFPAFYYTPTTIDTFFTLGGIVQSQDFATEAMKQQNTSNLKVMEIGVHTLLSRVKAPFIALAHRGRALSSGLSEEQIESMKRGDTPQDFSREEKAFFELGMAIVNASGVMGKEEFKAFAEVLERRQIAAFAQLVGSYMYLASLEVINDNLVPES